MTGNRRRVDLRYADGHVVVFEWQVFEADEPVALGAEEGLAPVRTVASPDRSAMQVVLERRSSS